MSKPIRPRRGQEAGATQTTAQGATMSMDADVAAILGIDPLDLRGRGAANVQTGSIRPSTWALAATAVFLPALVVTTMALRPSRVSPGPIVSEGDRTVAASRDLPRAMQVQPLDGFEPARRTPRPSTAQARADKRQGIIIAPPGEPPPQAPKSALALNTPTEHEGAPLRGRDTVEFDALRARDAAAPSAAPYPAYQADVAVARLEAIDALRALRQK